MKLLFKFCLSLFLCIAFAPLLTACGDDDESVNPSRKDETTDTTRTLLMYFPWSGQGNALTWYFWSNISNMKRACQEKGREAGRVMVFIATSGTQGYIFNLDDYKGYTSDALANYQSFPSPSFTTASGIASIFGAMEAKAPATHYSLVIGCHGLGWIPAPSSSSASSKVKGRSPRFVPHWEYNQGDLPLTRYFGGTSDEYKTDISTLAEAIGQLGTKMDFILFDDCYMSTVEVAYDLRGVADYIIACPTEVMGDGVLAANVGTSLLGAPNYEAVCDSFRSHYLASQYPYGTIGVTKCSEIDSLARVMRKINALYTFDTSRNDSLQRMDGYLPTVFFDMGDYVSHLCQSPSLLAEFQAQLGRTVPYKAHTGNFPTVFGQSGSSLEYNYVNTSLYSIPIHTYSGITISEPSKNSKSASVYPETAWYKATH